MLGHKVWLVHLDLQVQLAVKVQGDLKGKQELQAKMDQKDSRV